MISLGLDIGSAAVKALVCRDDVVLGYSSLPVTISEEGTQQAVETACKEAGIDLEQVDVITATGYGRNTWQGQGSRVSELTCHALGASSLFEGVRTVIDIGGQDFKVIALDDKGTMSTFQMNDKCAAGTGRFLDVMRAILQLSWDELSVAAHKATKPAVISNTCTVFAESEVISQLATGTSKENVAAGVFASVAARVSALAKRVGIREHVALSGGAVQSLALRQALELTLEVPVLYSPLSQYTGALGAALYGQKQAKKES